MKTTVAALAHYLPPEVERLGVRRPIAVDPVGPSTLADHAARDALNRLGLEPDAIDFIIFATATPDVGFPGPGCYLQNHLGCGTIACLDIRGQCAGFLYGLEIAEQFLATGTYGRILLVGAEVHSSGLDYSPVGADFARRFGDGAGVAILESREDGSDNGAGRGLVGVKVHTDGRYYDKFWCEFPASRQVGRLTEEHFAAGRHFPSMDAESVIRFGEEALVEVVNEVLADTGVRLADVDLVIAAHVDPDTAETALTELGVEPSRRSLPSRQHGHIMAGSLPIALSEAVQSEAVGAGSLVCLAAAGAGFTWGAALVRL